jgi:two-component system, NtrC family, response regulator AtoC
MVVLSRNRRITLRDLPPEIREPQPRPGIATGASASPARTVTGSASLSMEDAEKNAIAQALQACGGNRTKAAQQLGISRRTLHRKLNEYRLHDLT